MTSILGISAFYHDSAACILKDGKIIAAAQEERFTRKKHDPSYPKNAIQFVLKYADNVTRGVANSLSMLIAIVISKVIYLWKPPYHFYIGSALIFTALFLYHKQPIKKSAILSI